VANTIGRRATLAGAVLLQGLALIAIAAVDSWWHVAVIWFLSGLPTGMQRPVARSLQQRLTPNELLGRVNIAARSFTRGVIIIGSLTAGAIATVVGIRSAFIVGGTIELAAGLMMSRALATVDTDQR